MTARSTWKASERRFAALLGGVRVPITGRQRGSAPDIAHELYAIEHKYGRVMSARMIEAIEQAEASAADSAKRGLFRTPLVTIENVRAGKRENGQFVLMRLSDFLEITSLDEDGGPPEPVRECPSCAGRPDEGGHASNCPDRDT